MLLSRLIVGNKPFRIFIILYSFQAA